MPHHQLYIIDGQRLVLLHGLAGKLGKAVAAPPDHSRLWNTLAHLKPPTVFQSMTAKQIEKLLPRRDRKAN